MPTAKLILSFPEGDTVYPLRGKRLRIGRNPDNDIVLKEPSVSRYHSVLEVSDSGFFLRDEKSTCGTWINGKRENGCILRGGEKIRFGKILEAIFVVEEQIPEVTQVGRVPVLATQGLDVGSSKRPEKSEEKTPPSKDVPSLEESKASEDQAKERELAGSPAGRGFSFLDRRMIMLLLGITLNASLLVYLIRDVINQNEQGVEQNEKPVIPTPDVFGKVVLASAVDHAEKGLRKYEQGDFRAARNQFDAALDLLFSLPGSSKYNRSIEVLSNELAPELKKRDIGRAYEEVVRYTQKAGAIPQEELSAYVSSQVRALMRTFRMDPESIPEMFMSRVHDQVENFLHRERGFFSRSLSRAGQHLPMIVRIFDEMYLPEELAYVALVESGFNAKAKSPAGAVGLWQFMPKTARDYGLDVSPERGTDERDDPVRSTKAAATYFKNLFMDFGAGSPMLVMAAYNAGEGRVRGALRKGRNPLQERTFWSLLEKQDLTEETNQYVPRILAAIIIAKEPARFGFSETEQEPEGLDEVVVKGGTSLEFVARICRMTCPRLLALNPDLAPETTVIPNSSIQYGLRVPKGFGDLIKAELKRMEGTGSSATRGDGS